MITTTLRHTPEAECGHCDWSQHGLHTREDAKWHAQRHPGHAVTVDVLTRSTYVRQP